MARRRIAPIERPPCRSAAFSSSSSPSLVSGTTVLIGRAWLARRASRGARRRRRRSPGRASWSRRASSPPASSCGPRICAGRPGRPTASRRPTSSRARARSRISSARSCARPSSDGEPITEGRLVRPGDRGFMAAVLTPGYRAVTVPVTVTSGLAGFVFPGDRVDLLLTHGRHRRNRRQAPAPRRRDAAHRPARARGRPARRRSEQGSRRRQDRDAEVTPKQAETIAVATELGNLSLSLRSLGHRGRRRRAAPYSHTWDSEATHLIAPPESAASPERTRSRRRSKVSVVRGDEV